LAAAAEQVFQAGQPLLGEGQHFARVHRQARRGLVFAGLEAAELLLDGSQPFLQIKQAKQQGLRHLTQGLELLAKARLKLC
jgi:hypothetical protein